MGTGVGPLLDLVALAKQGPWTNDPNDPSYPNHWHMVDPRPGEDLRKVYTGSLGGGLAGGMVNVRVTEGPTGRVVYVDKPKIKRVGPFAKAIGKAGDELGTFRPARYAESTIEVKPAAHRVRISTEAGPIRARDDLHIGRPSDLSPSDQLRHTWKILRS
jgi:hypothetical protein